MGKSAINYVPHMFGTTYLNILPKQLEIQVLQVEYPIPAKVMRSHI